ncbi:MAG: helix-turn-helix transcriptional regulator [Actinomycetota bacterium]|nr:helix-turn-helix transcriptional regulator [Actinomycetota bacterium]
MRTYGQYCPVARTSEIFAERWTPIIVRNLLGGATSFGQLRAGAPGIPKALLADRLNTLARAGVLTRHVSTSTRAVTYELTPAGAELKSVCDAMGAWGMRWLEVEPRHIDPAYILWATARLVDIEKLPEHQVVVRFDLRDLPDERYWMLLRRPQSEICSRYPGIPEDLIVCADADALAQLHLRKHTYQHLVRQQRISIVGPPALARAFPTWIRPSPYADAHP